MSTILKALRQLEDDEKRRAEATRLHSEVVVPSAGSASGPRTKLILGLSAGLVAGVVGFVIWFTTSSAPIPGAGNTALREPSPAIGPRGRPPVAGLNPPSEIARPGSLVLPRPPVEEERTASSPPPVSSPRPESSAPPKLAPGLAPSFAEDPRMDPSPPARAVAREASESGPVGFSTRSDHGVLSPATASLREDTSSGAEPQPKLEAVPPDPLPTEETRVVSASPASAPASTGETRVLEDLLVLGTTWHPRPEKRVAVVRAAEGGKAVELREGDPWRGFRIREIQLSNLVFERDGTLVIRPVGKGP